MIPFTRQEFFEVLAADNTTVWSARLGLYALGAVLVTIAVRGRSRETCWIPLGLALLWALIGSTAVFLLRVVQDLGLLLLRPDGRRNLEAERTILSTEEGA